MIAHCPVDRISGSTLSSIQDKWQHTVQETGLVVATSIPPDVPIDVTCVVEASLDVSKLYLMI